MGWGGGEDWWVVSRRTFERGTRAPVDNHPLTEHTHAVVNALPHSEHLALAVSASLRTNAANASLVVCDELRAVVLALLPNGRHVVDGILRVQLLPRHCSKASQSLLSRMLRRVQIQERDKFGGRPVIQPSERWDGGVTGVEQDSARELSRSQEDLSVASRRRGASSRRGREGSVAAAGGSRQSAVQQ